MPKEMIDHDDTVTLDLKDEQEFDHESRTSIKDVESLASSSKIEIRGLINPTTTRICTTTTALSCRERRESKLFLKQGFSEYTCTSRPARQSFSNNSDAEE